MTTRTEVQLTGVLPVPLTGYLKAIALLRIIAEQVDAEATGWWSDKGFVIRSTLDATALHAFLLDRWAPTPIVAPWNGGSGFREKDNVEGIVPIEESDDVRFTSYRESIRAARAALASTKEEKATLLASLRATLPDAAIRWLDAAVILGSERPSFPPLLGTGGNDGRFEFSNTQMRRLVSLLLTPKLRPRASEQLRHALFGTNAEGTPDPIGQFAPGRAGGANTGFGFDGNAAINPWDFVLALEGALAFAASTSRAFENGGDVAYPFFVHDTPAGFGSSSASEESRGEMWMPLWERAVTYGELAMLIGEGRAWLAERPARTADDFSRAIKQLGVSRGIRAFQRYVFAQRNGLSFFATPAGRYLVHEHGATDPLQSIDTELERIRRAAQKDECPAGVATAWRGLTDELLNPRTASADDVLLALGRLSTAITRSRRAGALEFVRPIPASAPGSWQTVAASTDPAWEIACALSRGGIRSAIEPVQHERGRLTWGDLPRETELTADVPAYERLRRVGLRRLHEARPCYEFADAPPLRWASLHALLCDDGALEQRLRETLPAAVLIAETTVPTRDAPGAVPLAFALCAAALHRETLHQSMADAAERGTHTHEHDDRFRQRWLDDSDDARRLPVRMLELLGRGRGEDALLEAVRHLRASDLPLIRFPALSMPDDMARRVAVALLVPLSHSLMRAIRHTICLEVPSTVVR